MGKPFAIIARRSNSSGFSFSGDASGVKDPITLWGT
jgi:hypothetical protein